MAGAKFRPCYVSFFIIATILVIVLLPIRYWGEEKFVYDGCTVPDIKFHYGVVHVHVSQDWDSDSIDDSQTFNKRIDILKDSSSSDRDTIPFPTDDDKAKKTWEKARTSGALTIVFGIIAIFISAIGAFASFQFDGTKMKFGTLARLCGLLWVITVLLLGIIQIATRPTGDDFLDAHKNDTRYVVPCSKVTLHHYLGACWGILSLFWFAGLFVLFLIHRSVVHARRSAGNAQGFQSLSGAEYTQGGSQYAAPPPAGSPYPAYPPQQGGAYPAQGGAYPAQGGAYPAYASPGTDSGAQGYGK